MSFFVHSLLISWHHLQENNIQVPDTSCNVPFDWCEIYILMQQSDGCEIQTLMWRPDCNIPLYTLSMTFFFQLKKDDSKNCYPHMKQILSLKKKGKTFTGQYILHKVIIILAWNWNWNWNFNTFWNPHHVHSIKNSLILKCSVIISWYCLLCMKKLGKDWTKPRTI